jgi:hypothetical protein
MSKTEEVKKKIVDRMVKAKENFKNQKYGEFIIQTNNIQFYLLNLILLRSGFLDNDYKNYVERATLGQLIFLFCACINKNTKEILLIPKLKEYQEKRNKLAHKMYTLKKLTMPECEQAIKDGEKLEKALDFLLKNELESRGKSITIKAKL